MSACDIFLELFSNSCVESVCIDKVDVDMCVYGGWGVNERVLSAFKWHTRTINQSYVAVMSNNTHPVFWEKNSLKLHSVDKGPSDHLTKYFW